MNYDRVNITLNEDTDKMIKEIETEYHLERGRSAVIRMAVANFYSKVFGGDNGNTDKEKIAQV